MVVLGRVTSALFVVGGIGSSFVTRATRSPGPLVLTLLHVGAAAGWHAVLTSFDRHSRAAWAHAGRVVGHGAVARLGGGLLGADVGVLGRAGGTIDALVLGSLLHRDSRERVARPLAPARG